MISRGIIPVIDFPFFGATYFGETRDVKRRKTKKETSKRVRREFSSSAKSPATMTPGERATAGRSVLENLVAISSKQPSHFTRGNVRSARRGRGCAVSIVIKPFALLSYNNCITRRRRSLRLQGAPCIVTLITSRKLC